MFNQYKVVVAADATEREIISDMVEMFWQDIWSYLYAMTRDVHLASDLAQDTFISACSHHHQLNSAASMRAWMFAIARNRLRDHAKSSWFRRVRTSAEPAFEQMDSMRDSDSDGIDAAALAIAAIERDELWQAIGQLDAKFREVVILHIRADLTFREIAELLGIPGATARSRYGRAVKQLQKRLQRGDTDAYGV